MESTEFTKLAQRCNDNALKTFCEYASIHSKLGVNEMFSPDRMSTPEGVVELSETIIELREVTSKYKNAFVEERKTIGSALAKALEDLPAEDRLDQNRMLNIVEWLLESQGRFYVNRERWLNAVSGLCELIQGQWEGTTKPNHGDRFSTLMSDLNETQMIEQQLLQEREGRLRMSAEMLGIPA